MNLSREWQLILSGLGFLYYRKIIACRQWLTLQQTTQTSVTVELLKNECVAETLVGSVQLSWTPKEIVRTSSRGTQFTFDLMKEICSPVIPMQLLYSLVNQHCSGFCDMMNGLGSIFTSCIACISKAATMKHVIFYILIAMWNNCVWTNADPKRPVD